MIKDIVVQNVEYFMKHKEMMYPSGLVLKSKQMPKPSKKKLASNNKICHSQLLKE
jgi:hypothetical protein